MFRCNHHHQEAHYLSLLKLHLLKQPWFDLQIDAKNSYLFTYNTFIKSLYMFRALHCSSSGGLRRNCVYAASGIVTVCRLLSCAPVKKERVLQVTVLCTG
jgi:hypothetical protein